MLCIYLESTIFLRRSPMRTRGEAQAQMQQAASLDHLGGLREMAVNTCAYVKIP
jgi:hypothetical protein